MSRFPPHLALNGLVRFLDYRIPLKIERAREAHRGLRICGNFYPLFLETSEGHTGRFQVELLGNLIVMDKTSDL